MESSEVGTILEVLKELCCTDLIPPYEEEIIRLQINQINNLFDDIKQTLAYENIFRIL